MVAEVVMTYAEHFTYLAIFLFLILCGLGFPVPEEVLLVIAGYVAYKGLTSLYLIGPISFAGVIGGDLILFLIGKGWSGGVREYKIVKRIIGDTGFDKIKQFYHKHGNKAIVIARFISGLRVAVFLSAGVMGIKMKKFLTIDALAGLVSVPIWIGAGYFMGGNIDLILRYAKDFGYLFLIALPFIVTIIVVLYLRSKWKVPFD